MTAHGGAFPVFMIIAYMHMRAAIRLYQSSRTFFINEETVSRYFGVSAI